MQAKETGAENHVMTTLNSQVLSKSSLAFIAALYREAMRGQAGLYILRTTGQAHISFRAFNLIFLESDQLQSKNIQHHPDHFTSQLPLQHLQGLGFGEVCVVLLLFDQKVQRKEGKEHKCESTSREREHPYVNAEWC